MLGQARVGDGPVAGQQGRQQLEGGQRRGGRARRPAGRADSAATGEVEGPLGPRRTTARAVTLITLGVVGLGALNGTYLAPYGTTLGQLVLAVIAFGFVGALAWMRALTLTKPEPRFLSGSSSRGRDESVLHPGRGRSPSPIGLS